MIPPRQLPPPINGTVYCKNSDAPQASLVNRIRSGTDHLLRWRRKEVFSWSSPFGGWLSSSAGTRNRWRWRFHTGASASYVEALVVMATQNASHGTLEPQCAMSLTDVGAASTTTARQFFGATAGAPTSDSYNNCGVFKIRLAVSANTTYEGALVDTDGGRLVAATVYEVSNYGQYGTAHPVSTLSPILSGFRSSVMPALTNAWKFNAAHLWNWTVDNQATPKTITSTTKRNVIDGTSTTVSSATPGATLDLTYCNTAVGGDVPCVFAVYGSAIGASRPGEVVLKNSAGTVLRTITMTNGTAAKWWADTVSLPASEAKYDVQFSQGSTGAGGTTVSAYAFSLYQYLA